MSSFRFSFTPENTYCISLESCPERWNNIVFRLKCFDMVCTRWTATTPDTLTKNFIHFLNSGQRACAESHYTLWEKMANENNDYFLILEDDAMFDYDWIKHLDQFVDKYGGPENWDLIMLNSSEPIEPTNTWTRIHDHYLTGGYIISRDGCKRLLSMFPNELWASDWMISRLQCVGRSLGYFPWLIVQQGSDSLIGSDFDADHKKVIRCLSVIDYPIEKHYI